MPGALFQRHSHTGAAMNLLCGYLLVFFVVATLACKTSKDDTDPNDDLPKTDYKYEIVGGSSERTVEDITDPTLMKAVHGIVKMLNDTNECINFQLVAIRDATKQAGARIEYRVGIIVQPVLSDPGDADCYTACIAEAIKDEQVVQAAVVVQDEENLKHSIELLGTPGIASKFGVDGEMFLDCTPTLPPTLLYGWSQMTQDELDSEHFQNAVTKAIGELNASAHMCFSHRLDYVTEGRTTSEPVIKYEWLMKVHRIYDDGLPGCRGRCADECSGVDMYKGNAEVTAPNQVTINLKLAN